MKSSIFKILAVLLTVASVAFMGLSIAAYYGRVDYASEMTAAEMKDYNFEPVIGETTTWKVTRRAGAGGGEVGTFATPYIALEKANADLLSRLSKERQAWTDATALLKGETGEIAKFQKNQAMDVEAMKLRISQLEQLSQQLTATIANRSEQLSAISVQSKAVRDETAQRRTDVVRLGHELDEARTDLFRLTELQRTLTDQLLRLQVDNAMLQERKAQLEGQVQP